jgi:hypothetical protein
MSRVCVVVPHINFANRSNGITVLLELALLLSKEESVGEIWIYPTWSDSKTRTKLPERYSHLDFQRRLPDEDTITIISETIQPKDITAIRKTGALIAWYNLGPPGAFEIFGLPYLKRKPWEIELSYSSFISLDFEVFFLQPQMETLEKLIQKREGDIPAKSLKEIKKTRKLKIAVYTGKGRWQSLPLKIAKELEGSQLVSFDRYFPTSKGLLYNTLLNCDALISMDSLSSLNAEANLLGCPVYCLNGLPDLQMALEYPLDLSGTAYTTNDFWYLYEYGFSPSLVRSDYIQAKSNNRMTAVKMLKYLSSQHKLIREQKKDYGDRPFEDLLTSSVDAYWETKSKAWEGHFNQAEDLKPEFIFAQTRALKNMPVFAYNKLKTYASNLCKKIAHGANQK